MLQRTGIIMVVERGRERDREGEGVRERERERERDRERGERATEREGQAGSQSYTSFLYSSGSTWLYCSMSWLVRMVQRSTSFLRASFSASKEFLVDVSEALASFASTRSDFSS